MPRKEELFSEYYEKNVLVTGGAGFIGSALVRKLLELNAHVQVIDNAKTLTNLEEILNQIEMYKMEILESPLQRLVSRSEVVFDLAEVINQNPLRNKDSSSEINWSLARHQAILERAVCSPKPPKIVFPSSKTVYEGCDENSPPFEENSLTSSATIYSEIKIRTEEMYSNFCEKGVPFTILRLAVPYGPRSQILHPGFGIVGWFIRKSLEEGRIDVYGDGKQLGDYIFIDDVVNALLISGMNKGMNGETFNVGSGEPRPFIQMAKIVANLCEGSIRNIPIPQKILSAKKMRDSFLNISKIKEEGWTPYEKLEGGLEKTVDFYKANWKKDLL